MCFDLDFPLAAFEQRRARTQIKAGLRVVGVVTALAFGNEHGQDLFGKQSFVRLLRVRSHNATLRVMKKRCDQSRDEDEYF
jgi:hypothetical protein